ncbi:SpoVR family protein [Pleionea sp. CnH1-48]|uniref:SpoVR family protein n=1 Tax=Pleionea sp. CnH1-48 TaxID=2954494 RepID=UPI002097FCE3|nr:SpoVR family protein [Pleionea sp. CnH1-48]MCO7225418.1 SpoVR family protein [Pleionea sp. CnH1-48]
MSKREPISTSSEWTFELIETYQAEIEKIAFDDFKLDTYPNQIEVITAEQMLDAYASVGMPIGYHHWSFGKHFIQNEQQYRRGYMGLAYEIVINSNPCIAYLMEENTMMMQALVIAHASYGHNSFFKGNYLFKTWTDAEAIIDYLVFAKNYVSQCEEQYGIDNVEDILDSCHALMNYGVDRYKRPYPLSMREEKRRQKEREHFLQSQVNELWRTTIPKREELEKQVEARFPAEPHENILYFIEKHAPLLEPWQREIVRIVRKLGQYFYPQRQTQVMNEGWATFWHYNILNRLYDKGKVTDGFILEFLQSHTNVVYQPDFDSKYFSGINPYALGYAMMTDIRRICENPTDEDKRWFPEIAGSNWLETLDFAMRNFKDESFVAQFLSPRVIREFKLFSILDDDTQKELEVTAIHDDAGYRAIRQALSNQYNLSMNEPNIQVYNVDIRGDRSLTLRHVPHNNVPLADSKAEVLKHLHRLWHFDVKLESFDRDGEVVLLDAVPPEVMEMEQNKKAS